MEATRRFKGMSMAARIGRLGFVVTIYCIWHERNMRIFQGNGKPYQQIVHEVIVHEVEKYICAKSWNWKVRRMYDNWSICKNWDMNERILV